MTKATTNFCILFLALAAVAWAQVVGLQQSYVCVCTGATIETLADHCHLSEFPIATCASEEEESHHDSEPHAPLKKGLTAHNKSGAPVSVQPPAPVMLFDLPDFARPVLDRPHQEESITDTAPPDPVESPPTALCVTECTVLLV